MDAELLPLLAKWLRRDLVAQLDSNLHKHFPADRWCVRWPGGGDAGKPPLRFLFSWRADGSGALRGHWRPLLDALPDDCLAFGSVTPLPPRDADPEWSTIWLQLPGDDHAGAPVVSAAATQDKPHGLSSQHQALVDANRAAALLRRATASKLGDLSGRLHNLMHIYNHNRHLSLHKKPCRCLFYIYTGRCTWSNAWWC